MLMLMNSEVCIINGVRHKLDNLKEQLTQNVNYVIIHYSVTLNAIIWHWTGWLSDYCRKYILNSGFIHLSKNILATFHTMTYCKLSSLKKDAQNYHYKIKGVHVNYVPNFLKQNDSFVGKSLKSKSFLSFLDSLVTE